MIQALLSRFRIWQRIAFLLMTFFIPLSVLGVFSLSGIESYIQFAEKEKVGAAMMRSLNALFSPIAHRASSKRNVSIDETLRAKALKSFDTLNELWEKNKDHLNLGSEAETPNELRRKFEALWQNSAPDIRDNAKDFIAELLRMIRVVGNRTNLVLDPDLDSYYMIDTIVNQVPEIHEALMMWQWLKETSASREEQAQYHGLIRIHLMPNVLSNMRNVQEEDKNFYGEDEGLQSQVSSWLSTLAQNQAKLEGTDEAVNHPELHDFYTVIGEAASREIEDLLDTRISHYTHMRQQAWVYTILALGLLPIFSIVFVRSITAPIHRLIQATCKAAKDGDLAQRVTVSGKDEIAELSLSFNLMVETLDMMVNRVQNSGLIVTSSAKEIAGVAKQQQATSAEIAATTLEIEATSKEISATTKQLSKTMQEVHEVAEGTASLAGEGQEGLTKMRETMQGIMSASGTISSKLSVLNERATKINSVITTITKVADQTNLLSLNAAIEAEKAGEYGQGFAVVAREIRRLADQTAVATFDIEQMVKEMQSSVSTGVMGMERFTDEVKRGVHDVESVSSQLGEIISQVQTLTPRFDSVSEGMQSQVLGAQQISEGLGQLSTAVQQTADSLMQSNHSIERLNEAAGGLQHGVERFKLSQNISIQEQK